MPYKRKDSPYWWIAWTDTSGRRISRSSGTGDHRKAKALELEKRAQALRLGNPQSDKLIDDVLAAYLAARSTVRAGYAIQALIPYFAGLSLSEITPEDVNIYKSSRGVKPGTLNKELGTARAAIRYCQQELGWQIPNPFAGRVPRENNKRLRWITRYRALRLIAAAKRSEKAPYLADLITVALHTGMRRGELLGLTWDRVDLKRNEIHLAPEHQKNRSHGTVPLNTTARRALLSRAAYRAEYCPSVQPVFTRSGEPIASIKKSFATACRVARIEDFHFHDLRHTCAAWLVQAGVPLRTVAEILRHSDISTTMRYAHLAPDDARSGVEALERSMNVVPSGESRGNRVVS